MNAARDVMLVLAILLAGCGRTASPWRGYAIEREERKRADDLRVIQIVQGRCVVRQLEVTSIDGLPIPAYVFEPRDGGGGAAVIDLHGGEHGTFSSRRVERLMPLVAKGWVVVAPDYRGSSGYGKRFYDAADYGGLEIDDALAVRDWIETTGLADGDRIAVMGSSHGGYNALMAVVRRPGGFAGCVDFYGPTDLVYRVTSTPEENPNAAPGDPEKFAKMVGATIEDDENAYRERSPRFVADRMDAPILIVHGTEDGVVRIVESEWLVEALQDAQHPDVEFMRIEGGRHGYPPELYIPAWERVVTFLERCLSPDG